MPIAEFHSRVVEVKPIPSPICRGCGEEIASGHRAIFDGNGKVYHYGWGCINIEDTHPRQWGFIETRPTLQ